MKDSKGFTLLEALIALSIWMVLSLSVVFIWQHTARHSYALIERQSTFENARVTMDMLFINIQFARTIMLRVEGDYILQNIIFIGDMPVDIELTFNIHAQPGDTWHHRLRLGRDPHGQEFSSNIAMIRVEPLGTPGDWRYMHITIKTGCESPMVPIILEGSVDIRYKNVTVLR